MTQTSNLSEQISAHRKAEIVMDQYSNDVLERLKVGDETDLQAKFLANICVELDVTFGVGEKLVLDWMLDHYISYEFERRVYPWYNKIWLSLIERGHDNKNKFEYFNDCHAFYIPCASKRVCVFGKTYRDTPRYLVIDDKLRDIPNWSSFYVRHIWDRTRLNCIKSVDRPTLSFYKKRNPNEPFDMSFIDKERVIYGDCRDPGHILTHNYTGQDHGKCDHVIWNLQAPLWWFFEVNVLWAALEEEG